MRGFIYGLTALFFAIVLGFQVNAARGARFQPPAARVARVVNIVLTLVALGIVIYGLLRS